MDSIYHWLEVSHLKEINQERQAQKFCTVTTDFYHISSVLYIGLFLPLGSSGGTLIFSYIRRLASFFWGSKF